MKDTHDQAIAGVPISFEQRLGGKKLKRKIESNGDGLFELELPPGVYLVTVKYPGFRNFRQKGLRVEAGETKSFDIVLEEKPRKDIAVNA